MTRIAAETPKTSWGVIEEASCDAARDGAGHDEPPAADELLNDERDDAGDDPGHAAPCATPERDQHGEKENRHDEIDAVAARIGNQRAREITRRNGAHPRKRQYRARTEIDARIRAAFG